MHRASLTRHLARALAALVVAPLLLILGFTQVAQAHGNVNDPPSRNFRCYDVWKDKWQDPSMATADPMCDQAWKANTGAAMWLWMGLLRDGSKGQFQSVVPDGTLCSGGKTDNGTYDVLDTVGKWIPTPKPRSFTLNLRDDSSHGADYIQVYVSKQGFDPTTAKPKWSDLTLLKQTPRYAPANNYKVDVTVPADITGHHLLYTVWQASHLDQTYFFCSDVLFPGGSNPPVTTPPVTTPPVTTPPVTTPPVTTPPVTTAPPVTTPPVTTPPVTTAPVTTPPVTTTRPTTTPTAGGKSCSAAYKTVGQWGGGFQGEVTVTAGSSALTGWTVNWTWPAGQTLSQSWSSTVTSSGSSVTAKNATWNGSLAAGAGTSFGFLGSGSPATPTLTCTAV